MALLSEHLVGRAEELGAFNQLLAGLDSGEGAAVALVGEPGIGKTRLLAELAARSDARGHLVLSGSASELERDLPFWVFVDALEEYIQALDPRVLASLDEDVRTELGRVFPSLSALASGRPPASHERYRSHRAVSALLARLAKTTPVVLVLDDLHWADTASIELLGALLRRPPSSVLMALAMRQRQLPERLSAALENAHRADALVRIELRPLSRSESGELLGTSVDGSKAAALHEESGGNPFYLEHLARSLSEAPATGTPGRELWLGDVDVPPSVAAALAEELGLLSEDARLVLEGAAVAGDPFEPELAAAAASTPEACAIEALDELLQLGLVRETYVPRRFRFRHPLVRRAVYESTPAGWRLGAHERTARALEDRGAPASGSSAPHRALRTSGRSVRHRDVALRRRGDGASSTGQRSTVVRRRSQPAACRHRGRGAGRAPAGAGGIARGDWPILREPCRADRVPRAGAGRSNRAARAPDHGLRGGRALARPSPRGAPPSPGRAGRPRGRMLRRRRRADDRARGGRVLPDGVRGRCEVGPNEP